MTTPFKVCCIQSTDEVDMAVGAGAQALGLVAQMVSGPGVISDQSIAEISAYAGVKYGPDIWAVLLTSRTDKDGVVDHIAKTGVNAVQLVDYPDDGVHLAVKAVFPHIRLIQVIHVEDESATEIARRHSGSADYILLDSGKPSAPQKTFGGTGETHDWTISAHIVETLNKPVYLAGGLNPNNVAEAVKTVRPYGVDICSGLRDRRNGYSLRPEQLEAFAENLRNA